MNETVLTVDQSFHCYLARFKCCKNAKKRIHFSAAGRDDGSRSYVLMCRVVNDPYDVLGCWCDNDFFLSGTMSIEGMNLLVSFLSFKEMPSLISSLEGGSNAQRWPSHFTPTIPGLESRHKLDYSCS